MKTKITFNIAVLLVVFFAITGCRKYNDDPKGFLDDHEIIYPGLATNTNYNTGNLRAELFWNPSPDPSITKYVIKWNNGADSMSVNATSHDPKDTVKVVVPNLKEYVYSFNVVSYDNQGNRSVGQEINNVRVYGGVYISTLLNRSYNVVNPYELKGDGSVQVNFIKADSMNVATEVKYTDNTNTVKEVKIGRDDTFATLPNYKVGSLIQYRSLYVPETTSIDSFAVADYDELPIQADKNLFAELFLPGDIESAYGWLMHYLWDNNLNEPGFHTQGASFPLVFTFDMGSQSALKGFKMYQRMGSVYDAGNAKKFEIYGSNSYNPDGSWESWTKLATCNSVKPSNLPYGQVTQEDRDFAAAGEYFAIPATAPEVRYIRIKILDTWSGSAYFHALELTFFKQNK